MVARTEIFSSAFGGMRGGKVLDVATGRGGFVQILAANLQGIEQILGVDLSLSDLYEASEQHGRETIRFACMDAVRLGAAEAYFDTVSLSASLHHLADINAVLQEALRAIKPGGTLIFAEMHCDVHTQAQLTAVKFHHWVAAVDTALGISHNPTLRREELIDWIKSLGLRNMAVYDHDSTGQDPMDKVVLDRYERAIDSILLRARKSADYRDLETLGERLRWRLRKGGVQPEPIIVITGQK